MARKVSAFLSLILLISVLFLIKESIAEGEAKSDGVQSQLGSEDGYDILVKNAGAKFEMKSTEVKPDEKDDDSDSDSDDDDDDDDEEEEEEELKTYELKRGDISVKFLNWGATIVSLHLPDKNGKVDDVVLGYDNLNDYKNDTVYFGALVGRVANRIGKARFQLNGKEHKTVPNDGQNTLHGGKKGFGDVIWKVKKFKPDAKQPSIEFTYHSHDGEEGFPGDLHVTVKYSLVHDHQLSVVMKAKPKDKATPVNLAQHTYWNLGGHASGDILSEKVQLFASKYTPVDGELIPTGEILPVKGTPFDFLELHEIKDRINEIPKGYDINYCLDGKAGTKKLAAIVEDMTSGRKMELYTDQPGLQFYTGGQLKAVKGKNGAVYGTYAALALETQVYPDALNHPNFPSVIVEPGKTYKHHMLYKFSTV